MRFISLAAILALAAMSVASIACGGSSAAEPGAAGDPATNDGASEEVKAAVIDETFDDLVASVVHETCFDFAATSSCLKDSGMMDNRGYLGGAYLECK